MIKKIFILYPIIFATNLIHAAKEIELKISVPPHTYAHIEAWLKNNANYIGESEQKEYYITHPQDSWDYTAGFKDTLKTMRVRHEQKGDSFCYKYRHLDPVTKKTSHRDEYEIKIENGDTMINILKLLGYTEHTVITKKRTTYLIQNIFEVVFDDVQNVGKFMEIELKEPTDDVKSGIAKIEQLLKEMGIREFTQYDRSYIHMIWNPHYDFGVQRTL